MPTRKHTHEELFPTTPERLFSLLHTPSAIRGWWGAARAIVIPKEGGIWCATWGDDEDAPDYITAATLRVFDPPRRLVFADYQYMAKTGPLPFRAEFVTEFTVTPSADGAALESSRTASRATAPRTSSTPPANAAGRRLSRGSGGTWRHRNRHPLRESQGLNSGGESPTSRPPMLSPITIRYDFRPVRRSLATGQLCRPLRHSASASRRTRSPKTWHSTSAPATRSSSPAQAGRGSHPCSEPRLLNSMRSMSPRCRCQICR